MSFVSNDKHVENYESMRLEELRKELKARNAKVSGRKHDLMDRSVLFIRMTSCRARVSLFDEEKVGEYDLTAPSSSKQSKPVAPHYDLIRAACSRQYGSLLPVFLTDLLYNNNNNIYLP